MRPRLTPGAPPRRNPRLTLGSRRDCPHAPGGRDTHIAFPDRIRCKDCAKAEKARAHAEARRLPAPS